MSIDQRDLAFELPADEAEHLLVLSALGKHFHTDDLTDWDAYKLGDYRLSDSQRMGGCIVVLANLADETQQRLELTGEGNRLSGSELGGQALGIIIKLVAGTPEVHRPR